MTYHAGSCDVAVIGAGHAGIEAALAAARLGQHTILFTINMDAVGNMPCNPAIGGTGKGHIVRELDALGGEMGVAADKACIQYRMLNRGKGPAVHSLRAQADRRKYQQVMKHTLELQENLELKQAQIVQILTDPKNLMPLIEAAFAIITALINGLLSPESLNKMIEMLPQIVENIVDILIDSIDLLLDAAVALIEALCDYFFEPQNLAKIVQATYNILVKIAEGIIAAIWKVGEAVQAINDKIISKLAENWERLKQAGRDLLDSIMNGVKEKWNEWTGWWEDIGGWIYDKLHPDGGDLFDFGGGDEPAMATGGIVTAPTRALIGENGAEAILPLESNTHWMDILAAKIAGAGGSGVTIGEINVDVHGADGASNIGYTIVSKIDEALRSYQVQQARGYGGSGIG